ncbi:MAG TPA: hypothetical protein VN657_06315 [Nitrospiraceae bacterium]|nr:hypothetical protein [Nitrospiraceae bacterium]
MTPPSRHSVRTLSRTSSCVLALLCLVGTACGTLGPSGKVLSDDPRGTVSLETIPDPSIHATHPITLDPVLLAQILKGIQVQDQGDHMAQKLLSGPSYPVPVFSDQHIQFLAPLLAEGLRTALPDEQIEYSVQTIYEGSGLESSYTETTAGSLYAYGRQLFVTLSQYRYSKARANVNIRNINYQSVGMDYTGLRNHILLFTPKVAQRSDSFDPPPSGKSTDRFLAIDYQLLQHAPVATTGRPAPETVSDTSAQAAEALAKREAEIQALRDRVNKNASEMETLRKELQSVQDQLGPTTGPDSQKRKTTPSSKP